MVSRRPSFRNQLNDAFWMPPLKTAKKNQRNLGQAKTAERQRDLQGYLKRGYQRKAGPPQGPRFWRNSSGNRQRWEGPARPLFVTICHKRSEGRPSPLTEEGYLSRMRPQLGAVSLPARSESVTQKRYAVFVFAFGAAQASA
jgi:hypothetical protein